MKALTHRANRKTELWISAGIMSVAWVLFAFMLASVSFGILFFGLSVILGVIWISLFLLIAWLIPAQIVRYFREIRTLSSHQPHSGGVV